MTVFDDYEPEDAWSPDDPISLQVLNLLRRLALLVQSDGVSFERRSRYDRRRPRPCAFGTAARS